MTHTTAYGVERAIMLCVGRCRHSPQPYLELGRFVWALRAGGVSESLIGMISNAVLRDIASAMIKKGAASSYAVQ